VEQLLEKSLGQGNVRAEVTVDMDLDRTTTNSESFDPDGQVVRSTQTVSDQGRSSEGQAQNVTVANNLPNAGATDAGGQAATSNLRTEETVNYEISKKVTTQVREAGLIRRLSIAVLVNGVAGAADAQGKKTFTPRGEEELKQLATLVRSTVGFDAKRGDTVEVLSMPFADMEEVSAAPDAASFLGFTKSDVLRLIEVVALGLVAVLAMLFVVRPVLIRIAAIIRSIPVTPMLPAALAGPGPEALTSSAGETKMITSDVPPIHVATPGIDQMIDIAKVEGQVKASSMKKIGEIVEKHPEEAVAILRGWLAQQT
jgi:flagellar M-ring protein FliF